MKAVVSDFEYGRTRVKYTMVIAVLTVIAALFFDDTAKLALELTSLVFFALSIYTLVKYCRCPHCGKVIVLGVLAIRQCPRCKHDLITGKKMKKSK